MLFLFLGVEDSLYSPENVQSDENANMKINDQEKNYLCMFMVFPSIFVLDCQIY